MFNFKANPKIEKKVCAVDWLVWNMHAAVILHWNWFSENNISKLTTCDQNILWKGGPGVDFINCFAPYAQPLRSFLEAWCALCAVRPTLLELSPWFVPCAQLLWNWPLVQCCQWYYKLQSCSCNSKESREKIDRVL